jgi:uncharacterized protein DUF4157
MSTQSSASAQKSNAAATAASVEGFAASRQCACGQHSTGGAECETCRKGRSLLQRHPNGMSGVDGAMPFVHAALNSTGQPLDRPLRHKVERALAGVLNLTATAAIPAGSPMAGLVVGPTDDSYEAQARRAADHFVQSRTAMPGDDSPSPLFHDFSDVRVHSGALADRAAAMLGARAFTVGRDIVFASGEYDPASARGQWLIAHELTHVVQQFGASAQLPRLQRATAWESFGRTLRDIVLFIPSLFGLEFGYGDSELQEYLQGVTAHDHIDGGYYSDNKARALVARWKTGNSPFQLSPRQKELLILEMQDGIVTNGDRRGIIDILRTSAQQGMDLDQLFGSGKVDLNSMMRDVGKEQFDDWFLSQYFVPADAPTAKAILDDIFDVKQGQLDFANFSELHDEVFKRMRTAQLLKESQGKNAAGETGFDYPENVTANHHCAEFYPPAPGTVGNIQNARVNKAARRFWTSAIFTPDYVYYFELTPDGRNNGFEALTSLFTPQHSICDQTLIHCDYLITVVEFRAYAEGLGSARFNSLVKSGAISMVLTYTGFPKDDPVRAAKSPKAFGYQWTVPASKEDLIIGDHVMFFNHLAFDGLNETVLSPWRLENAILVDKNAEGKDLFEGHGEGPDTEHDMLKALANAYNELARPAREFAMRVDAGSALMADLTAKYPAVDKVDNRWIVRDPARDDPRRHGKVYTLRTADTSNPENDSELPGLRDPGDMSRMAAVERPIESSRLPPPTPTPGP